MLSARRLEVQVKYAWYVFVEKGENLEKRLFSCKEM